MTLAPTPLTELPPEVERAYDKYVRDHHGDLSDTPGLALTMWCAGGRHMLSASVEFGDILPRLSNMERRLQAMRALLEQVVES